MQENKELAGVVCERSLDCVVAIGELSLVGVPLDEFYFVLDVSVAVVVTR